MESVRPAGPSDLAPCAALLRTARRQAATRRGGAQLVGSAVDDDQAVAAWLSAPDGRLLVGTIDEVVVGLAYGEAPGTEGGPARIACCYVEPAARQVGVGGALLAQLVAWLADRGCDEVDAPALPGDRPTKQLFEAAGFKARLLVLHRRLR